MTRGSGYRWGSMALFRKTAGKARRATLFCTTALVGAVIWVPAFAADTNWTGATSSDWFTATNWDTVTVPSLGANAIIDTTTPNAAVLAGGTPVDNLVVGNASTGMLTIASGGSLAFNAAIGYLGNGAGSSGTVAITGPGSNLSALHTLDVGNNGSGTLAVSNGGAMTGSDMMLGVGAGGTGTVTADGLGSQLFLSNDIAVGVAGNGTLQITNGAVVNTSNGDVGQLTGSTGTATVDGAGSRWSNSGVLLVGDAGTGTLTISNGASASGGYHGIRIGESATGIGTITVTGNGSTLSTNPFLIVGDYGTGTLTIENGATGAISGPIDLGSFSGSSGTVTVTGAGSTLQTFATLNVGDSGTGTLNVQDGGAVTAVSASLGFSPGSSGQVTVAGTGSSLTTSFGLIIGYFGAGALTVLNGGTVQSTSFVALGYGSGSSGTVTVDGAGSNFNTPSLFVGYLGAGTLTVSKGGTVTASDVFVASFFGSTGTINIGAAAGQAPVAPGTITANGIGFGLGTGSIVFNHTSSNYVFAVPVSGAGSLDVENGTTVLTAANSYSGGTTINGGVLRIAGAGTLGYALAGMTMVAGGTLDLGGTTQTQDGGIVLCGGAIVNGTLSSSFVGFDLQSGTVSAALAGPVALVKSGTGTVTLSGINTYTGATKVNGGTLAATADNNLGAASGGLTFNGGTLQFLSGFTSNRTVKLNAGGGSFDTDGNHTVLSGVVSGAGTLTKAGPGTLILTANDSHTGATVVNGGILSVNGSIASSSLTTVNAGGTLGGNGIVGNTTVNGGALAPGNSIGLLTVQGSLVLTAASSYMVEVSPTNADRVNVTGTATLGGATVNASFAAGTYVAKQYTIVNATGGVNGSFGAEANTNLPANFHASLGYDANNAYLNLVLNFAVPTGLNGNQQNVGNALTNFFNATGGIPIVYGALTPAALTQASGEVATGSQQTTFNAMNLFMGVMTDPFVAGRDDSATGGGVATPFAEQNDSANAFPDGGKPRSKSERDANAAIYRKALPRAVDPLTQHWSVWVAGYGGSQTTDGNVVQGSNTASGRVYGTAVGADYRFSPFTLAGFCAGRRRHQFLDRQWIGKRPLRPVPGRRSSVTRSVRPISQARSLTAGRTLRQIAPSPSPASTACARSSTPTHSRVEPKAAPVLSRRGWASRPMPQRNSRLSIFPITPSRFCRAPTPLRWAMHRRA
jgi:T5SS/PEP-CTERM-associated repeat protein/autotransporter-associated beta strand protein